MSLPYTTYTATVLRDTALPVPRPGGQRGHQGATLFNMQQVEWGSITPHVSLSRLGDSYRTTAMEVVDTASGSFHVGCCWLAVQTNAHTAAGKDD